MTPAKKPAKAKRKSVTVFAVPYRLRYGRWYVRMRYTRHEVEESAAFLKAEGFASEVGPVIRVEVPL